MAFKFRLQAVLEHREYLEDLARHEFASQLAKQQQCKVHIAWLEGEHARARAELQERELSGMQARDFVLANEYVTVLRLQAMREQARLPLLESNTNEARQKLVAAARERKTMEALKKKHRAAWEREQLLMEQRLLDEAAINAYYRRGAA